MKCWFGLLFAFLIAGAAASAEVTGARIGFVDYSGPARLSVKATDKYELRIDIDPQAEHKTLTLQVELSITGPDTWPIVDVAVFDLNAKALPVRRGGIEWHKLFITVPPERTVCFVRAVEPAGGWPNLKSRTPPEVTDPRTGLSAAISKWFDGRRAALSIRFDDSDPTHLDKAIPILNEYGFRGTFMVNPAGPLPGSRRRSAFEDHQGEWEAVARRGAHEFANHTMNHRGAQDDESMEYEIGAASKAIWKLFPEKSQLLALNLGGGTQWVTTRPLRYYLDKYHLFDASANSTGMDDSYGNRVETCRRLLQTHIERGLWYKMHYHSIGDGLSSSEANFRGALDIAKRHEDQLWIAGMADIFKYQTERLQAKLKIENRSACRSILRLSCPTNVRLYDQPLTIDVRIPESWTADRVVITNHNAEAIKVRTVPASDAVVMRFDADPSDSEYTIEEVPYPN